MTDVSRCSSASSAASLSFSVDVTAEPEGQDASHTDTLTGCRFTLLLRDESQRHAAVRKVKRQPFQRDFDVASW